MLPARDQRGELATPAPAPSTKWRRSDHCLWRIAFDDVVLVDSRTDDPPFVISGGADMWRALAEPVTAAELLSSLGGGPEAPEMLDLLSDLAGRGVLEEYAV